MLPSYSQREFKLCEKYEIILFYCMSFTPGEVNEQWSF